MSERYQTKKFAEQIARKAKEIASARAPKQRGPAVERTRQRLTAAAGVGANLAQIRSARAQQEQRNQARQQKIQEMMDRIQNRTPITPYIADRPTVESAQLGMADMMQNLEAEQAGPEVGAIRGAVEDIYTPAVRAALRLTGSNVSAEQIGETLTNYYDLRSAQLDEALPLLAEQLRSEMGTDVLVDDARFAGWDDGRARYNVRVSSYTKDGSYIHSRMELRQRYDDSFSTDAGKPITGFMSGEVGEEQITQVLDAFAAAAESGAESPHQAAVESLIADGVEPEAAATMVTETMQAMYDENITWMTPLNRTFDIIRNNVDIGLSIMAEMTEEERQAYLDAAKNDYGLFDDIVNGNPGGGGGGRFPEFVASDRGMVSDFVKSMITTLIGVVPDGMLDELTNIYLDAEYRAFNGESIDPRQAVREAIRRTAQYKAIHKLRPDAISEDDWLATHIQALTAAGVRVGEIVERAIKQATAGVSPARAGEAGGISEFAGTGRANPKFINDMSRVAAATFRRVF